MSVLETQASQTALDGLQALLADPAAVPSETVQELLTAAVRLYVARRAASDEAFPPVADSTLTATEAAVMSTALLRSAQLETFELALWNSLGRI